MAEQFYHQQFSGLELLPTPLLEEIIRTDFHDEADYSEAMIQYVLELIEKRKKEESPSEAPDVDQAWSRFQQLMEEAETEIEPPRSPTHQHQEKPAKKSSSIFRYMVVVAACITILFAMLITVQAAGINVFGTLATWTDSTFRFVSVQEESTQRAFSSESIKNELQRALAAAEIPTSLAPTWIPEAYSLTGLDTSQTTAFHYVHATYAKPGSQKVLTITIDKGGDCRDLSGIAYEKNSGDPEIYEKDGMQFYLFKNWDVWSAVYYDGNFSISLTGIDSKETAIRMIDSIQEDTYE